MKQTLLTYATKTFRLFSNKILKMFRVFSGSKICVLILEHKIFIYHKQGALSECFFISMNGSLEQKSSINIKDWISKNCRDTTIILAINDSEIITRHIVLPFTNPIAISQTLAFKIEQNLPATLEDSYVSFQIFDSQETTKSETTVKIIHKDHMERTLSILKNIGITPDFVCAESVGMAEFAKEIAQEKPNCSVMWFRQSVVTALISMNGKLINCKSVENTEKNISSLMSYIENQYNLRSIQSAHLISIGNPGAVTTKSNILIISEINESFCSLENICENVVHIYKKNTFPTHDFIKGTDINKYSKSDCFKSSFVFIFILTSISSIFSVYYQKQITFYQTTIRSIYEYFCNNLDFATDASHEDNTLNSNIHEIERFIDQISQIEEINNKNPCINMLTKLVRCSVNKHNKSILKIEKFSYSYSNWTVIVTCDICLSNNESQNILKENLVKEGIDKHCQMQIKETTCKLVINIKDSLDND